VRRELAQRFRCPKCEAPPGEACEGEGGSRKRAHRERHDYAAAVMARTRELLAAIGRHGATERQLRARGVDLEMLPDVLRRRWVERYQYPEERGWCFRLTDSGRALLEKRSRGS
jgi:hypothetical protein